MNVINDNHNDNHNDNQETIEDSNLTHYYHSRTNVTGDAYIQLMKFLFEKSHQFIIVIRDDIFKDKDINKIIEELSPFLIKKVRQGWWASTDLDLEDYDSPATVYFYNSTNEALDIVLNRSDNLFQWVQPSLPEDISFLIDGAYFFTTTTHEKEYRFIDIPNCRIYGENAVELPLIVVETYST